MNESRLQELALGLWQSRLSGQAVEPLTAQEPALDLAGAYRISLINLERRLQAGVRTVGKKIGLTSLAVQKQLGVSEPDFGYLTSDMQIVNGGELRAGSLIQGRFEGEVAFVLKRALRGPGVKAEDVPGATAFVCATIEIIDSRVRDWKIRIQDTVADNASSAFYVLGEKRVKPEAIDLAAACMRLWVNGEQRSQGQGTACLGHPYNAVAWLANKLGELGGGLEAGDLVLSGAYGPVVPVQAGDDCAVEIDGLGRVGFRMGKG